MLRSGTHAADELDAGQPADERIPERSAYRVLGFVALLLMLAALLLVILADTPGRDHSGGAGDTDSAEGGGYAFIETLERQPIDSLPTSIGSFETMGLQQVPGDPAAAEAIYASMDLDKQVQRPVGTYARVQAFPSSSEADARVQELLVPYTLSRETVVLGGVTLATSGRTEDRAAWLMAWRWGQYAVSVRTFYQDRTPAQETTFLEDQGIYVAQRVELYQRTGIQGPAARGQLSEEPERIPAP